MCKKLVLLATAALVLAPAIASATLTPVGWWKFDETTGTTAADSAGTHNGTLLPATGANPAATWTAGKLGGAIQFGHNGAAADNQTAATNPYVELPIGDLISKLGDCTFGLWINWAGTTYGAWQRAFDFGSTSVTYAFLTMNAGTTATSQPRFAIRTNNGGESYMTATSAVNVRDNAWHHFAISMNATTKQMTLYVDGVANRPNVATNYLIRDMGATTQNWVAKSQYSDPYFVGTIDDLRIYDRILSGDDLVSVMNGGLGYGVASNPTPANAATNVLRDQPLSWTAGIGAVSHNVYLGTDPANLTKIASALTAGTFNQGRMQLGTKYYWRVDEVQADGSVIAGNPWSFTTELLATALVKANITANASSWIKGSDPNMTIDGSGIDANGLAGILPATMWASDAKVAGPVWIQYTFDRVYPLYQMWVWNYNIDMEDMVGYGIQNATIEYTVDGITWQKLKDVLFNDGLSADGYACNNTVDFGGLAVKGIKITAIDNFGGMLTYGLSEVRFYYLPAFATTPSPATAAIGQRPDLTLGWRPGRGAATHNVYLGTDPNNLTLAGSVPASGVSPTFNPAGLQLGGLIAGVTYYWRVDEVNNAWVSPVISSATWSFTTLTNIVVDDMESYLDDTTTNLAIFQIWKDGVGTTTNGSQVGYQNAPFTEKNDRHGGAKSMPFIYANTGTITTSEATRTFDTAQDWTIGGITTLVLFVRPDAANTASPKLYVKINNTPVNFTGTLVASPAPLWSQWSIDLTKLTGLNSVKSLTIGVTGAGSGKLFIDDIQLWKSFVDPTPKDPGTANLVSYFNMEGGKVFDPISNTTAVNLNATTFVSSLAGLGQALMCSSGNTTVTDQYVDLGTDYATKVITKLSSCTFSVWVNYDGQGSIWQRPFDFGCGTNTYVFLSTSGGSMGLVRFAVKTNVPNAMSTATGYQELGVNGNTLSLGWHHIAAVVDATGGVQNTPIMYVYTDGVLTGGPAVGRLPKDMVLQTSPATWQNYLGKSQYADPYLHGAVDELKVYNRALTAGEINFLAGGK